MKRISFLLLAGIVVFLLIIFLNDIEEEPYSTGSVLEEAWDKFGLESFYVGVTNPVLYIKIDENTSETELRTYLEQNLSQSYLEYYTIDISPFNEQT